MPWILAGVGRHEAGVAIAPALRHGRQLGDVDSICVPREQRSQLPCDTVVDSEFLSGSTLLLEHYRGDECGPWRRSWPCLLRLDLRTWKGQLYERPFDYRMEDKPCRVVPAPPGTTPNSESDDAMWVCADAPSRTLR